MPHWFPELTRIEGNKDHDHVDTRGRKYDAKNFTKGGLKFMPSSQLGAGRKFDAVAAHNKANKLIWNDYFQVFFKLINARIEINENHAQDDKSHPQGGNRIGHLTVFNGGKDIDQNQPYSGPNGIGHGDWNLFQSLGNKVKRCCVTDRGNHAGC